MTTKAIVFGASGTIGSAVRQRFELDGHETWGTSRTGDGDRVVRYDPSDPDSVHRLAGLPTMDVVVWAQGVNCNDSVIEFDPATFRSVMDVNTIMIVESLAALLRDGRLADGARLCVVSSVWQLITRQQKLSYTVSKAALDGVVRSAAIDLASRGILVNAVLPGVLDTPMTRSVLSAEQIERFENATGFGRLVQLEDVVNTVAFLCSEGNTGITGQSIAVDLGFTHARFF